MGLIRWIFGLLIALILVAFAVFNRNSVSLTWSPVHAPLELPLYMIGLVLMAIGFFTGTLMTWMNMSKVRQDRRRQKKQIKILEKELEAVNENGNAEAPSDFFPALPKRKK